MRTFVVSDLHGNGEVYNSIMSYLENVSRSDEVELYINGDLIDRGLDSFEMLKDVKERCEGKGKVKIHYLGGNHELMMYQFYKKYIETGKYDMFDIWFSNGALYTEGGLDCLEWEKAERYYQYVGDLKIYKKFPQMVKDKKILLVHSQPPIDIYDQCPLRIKDDTQEVFNSVWTREYEYEYFFFSRGPLKAHNNLGKDGYLVINGHTPAESRKGFIYNKDQHYLNIDGGCARYACGDFTRCKVPLVEIKDDFLPVLVFNHDNQIVAGYYFDGELIPMEQDELNERRKLINHVHDGEGEKGRALIKESLEILNE